MPKAHVGPWLLLKANSLFSLFSDLTGAQDGSVRMFEWGHSQQIICFRSPGNSRVTRIRFNHQGNKVREFTTVPWGLGTMNTKHKSNYFYLCNMTALWCEPVRFSNIFTPPLPTLPFRHEPRWGVWLRHTLFLSWLIPALRTQGACLELIIFSDVASRCCVSCASTSLSACSGWKRGICLKKAKHAQCSESVT